MSQLQLLDGTIWLLSSQLGIINVAIDDSCLLAERTSEHIPRPIFTVEPAAILLRLVLSMLLEPFPASWTGPGGMAPDSLDLPWAPAPITSATGIGQCEGPRNILRKVAADPVTAGAHVGDELTLWISQWNWQPHLAQSQKSCVVYSQQPDTVRVALSDHLYDPQW